MDACSNRLSFPTSLAGSAVGLDCWIAVLVCHRRAKAPGRNPARLGDLGEGFDQKVGSSCGFGLTKQSSGPDAKKQVVRDVVVSVARRAERAKGERALDRTLNSSRPRNADRRYRAARNRVLR